MSDSNVPTQPVQVKAHQLLSGPEKWTQGVSYRDANGNPVTRELASSYCVYGALRTCYGKKGYDAACHKVERVLENRGYGGFISAWNDRPGRTFEEVHALLVEADV